MVQKVKLNPFDNGFENAKVLQNAVDNGVEILVEGPGFYKISETIYIGDKKNCNIKDSKIKFEPFQVEGLKYPEVEVILDNTKISEDFITHTTEGITVK